MNFPYSELGLFYKIMKTAVGHAIKEDDMHWTVECPDCELVFEYKGFFDSFDITNCECGCDFKTEKVWINGNQYIS